MFDLKSINVVLENEPTGIKLYIKVTPPRKRSNS